MRARPENHEHSFLDDKTVFLDENVQRGEASEFMLMKKSKHLVVTHAKQVVGILITKDMVGWEEWLHNQEQERVLKKLTPAQVMVRPTGLEPATYGSANSRSIQLSHGRIFILIILRV